MIRFWLLILIEDDRVVGVQTGLTAIISVQVNADAGSSTPPDGPQETLTSSPGGSGYGGG